MTANWSYCVQCGQFTIIVRKDTCNACIERPPTATLPRPHYSPHLLRGRHLRRKIATTWKDPLGLNR